MMQLAIDVAGGASSTTFLQVHKAVGHIPHCHPHERLDRRGVFRLPADLAHVFFSPQQSATIILQPFQLFAYRTQCRDSLSGCLDTGQQIAEFKGFDQVGYDRKLDGMNRRSNGRVRRDENDGQIVADARPAFCTNSRLTLPGILISVTTRS